MIGASRTLADRNEQYIMKSRCQSVKPGVIVNTASNRFWLTGVGYHDIVSISSNARADQGPQNDKGVRIDDIISKFKMWCEAAPITSSKTCTPTSSQITKSISLGFFNYISISLLIIRRTADFTCRV